MHAVMSLMFGKNFLNPDFVWGIQDRAHVIQWEDTPVLLKTPQKEQPRYCILPTTCRTTSEICRGKNLGGSSNIRFYVFMYDIDSVIERFPDPH